jgi:LysM repeat protein
MKRTCSSLLGSLGLIVLGCLLLAPATAEAQAAASAPEAQGPESGYVVKQGDTLWGIS